MNTIEEHSTESSFGFFAFISYNKANIKWGKRLQHKLEGYILPTALRKEKGFKRSPLKPIFFAPSDIQPGISLPEELKEKLRDSQYLIVVCSPNSAGSDWVGNEIAYFCELRRHDRVFCFIIDGDPESKDEKTRCYHPKLMKIAPDTFGVNIHEKVYKLSWLNTERAYIQLISKLLGLKFDALWQRHKRLLIKKITLSCVGIIGILVLMWSVWAMNQPFSLNLKLQEKPANIINLPPLSDAVVNICLEDEMKRDTIKSIDSPIVFKNIPHHYLGKTARIHVACKDFYDIDTTMILVPDIVLSISRNPIVYGNIYFRLWDIESEKFLPNISVTVEGKHLVSDNNGIIQTFIPLESQKPVYHISSSVQLQKDSIIMPCSSNEVLFVGR